MASGRASERASYDDEPYSTLEVRDIESHKEVVDHGEKYLQTIHNYYIPKAIPCGIEAYRIEADIVEADRMEADRMEADRVEPDRVERESAYNDSPADTRICGLRRRHFYIILTVVVLAVIGAVAGGVAGGLANRKTEQSPASPAEIGQSAGSVEGSAGTEGPGETEDSGGAPPTENANVNILSSSQLAASNWTDMEGFTHRNVFFQDPYNSIIVRHWDSQNTSWVTRNLSQLMRSSTWGAIDPIPGTSLASTSVNRDEQEPRRLHEVHVWFLERGGNGTGSSSSSSSISRLSSKAPKAQADYWTYGDHELPTWDGSQLAAVWQRCWKPSCNGFYVLAYQGPDGAIGFANGSQWTRETKPIVSASAASAGASMALIATSDRGSPDGVILATQRRPDSMGRSSFKGNWEWEGDDGTIMGGLDPLQTRQFAATKLGDWNDNLFLALGADGGLRATRYDGETYDAVADIEFAGGKPTNFSAIATTADTVFYGIADDQIWEYTIDAADPSKFALAGRVYP